jgi:hypothetical protein
MIAKLFLKKGIYVFRMSASKFICFQLMIHRHVL